MNNQALDLMACFEKLNLVLTGLKHLVPPWLIFAKAVSMDRLQGSNNLLALRWVTSQEHVQLTGR